MFLVPLMNLPALKARIVARLLPKPDLSRLPDYCCAICYLERGGVDFHGMNADQNYDTESEYDQWEEWKAQIPVSTSCGHVYCYYCIASRMDQVANSWRCLRCEQRVTHFQRIAQYKV